MSKSFTTDLAASSIVDKRNMKENGNSSGNIKPQTAPAASEFSNVFLCKGVFRKGANMCTYL